MLQIFFLVQKTIFFVLPIVLPGLKQHWKSYHLLQLWGWRGSRRGTVYGHVVKKVIGITKKSSDAAAWCFQFSASDSKDKKTIFSSHVPKDF